MLHFATWKIALVWAVIAAGLLAASPNVLPPQLLGAFGGYFPSAPVNLGLDLRGGSHLLLEADVASIRTVRLETIRDEARLALRRENIGYRALRVEEEQVRIQLRRVEDKDKATELLLENAAPLQPSLLSPFAQGSSLNVESPSEGVLLLAPADEAKRQQLQSAMAQSIEIVRRRIDELGTTEPTIQRQGEERILVQVPGFDDPQRLKEILGQTAKLNFYLVNTSVQPAALERDDGLPPGTRLFFTGDEPPFPYALFSRPLLGGENLVDAQPAFDQITRRPIVTFRLDSAGARIFGEVTQANVGKPFAIVLDEVVVSAPVINEPIIGGRAQISGNFTIEQANDLAILLRAGALPVPLRVLEERTVGPGLGADSIRAGTLAAIMGFVAVVLYILLTYGLFGLYANSALVVNLMMVLGALSFLGATLTLPGIAGIVLTIGMAVDANVLIFERIREEIGQGKTPVNAIDSGYRRALGTILDANITTFIAAAILFFAGSGPVRGFAITLGIGIATSVFTAFTFTRMLAAFWIRWRRPDRLPLPAAPPIRIPAPPAL